VDGGTQFGFPLEPLGHVLFPYFSVESKKIDPYDGTEFEGAELDQLIAKLNDAIVEFSYKEFKWPLDDKTRRNILKL
jgi:hypothetical protein